MADNGLPHQRHATDIIEEGVHFLRLGSVGILLNYYVGTLPFVLGLMYFWSDMSRSALASSYCSVASLGMAVLFVWMKFWHAVFATRVYERAGNMPPRQFTVGSVLRTVQVQTILQVSGLFILPVMLLATIPYPWAYAFYQNVLLADCSRPVSLGRILRDTLSISKRDTLQNWKLISILSAFKLFVMLNIAVTLYIGPHLLKSLTGIETVFTMGGFSVMNSTFLVSVLCLTHLCVDPVVKTVYTLRFFYGESETTGYDLLAGLSRIAKTSLVVIIMIAVGLGAAGIPKQVEASANGGSQGEPSGQGIDASQLADSIDHVLKRNEFTWRMPRDQRVGDEDTGFLGDFFDWLSPRMESLVKTIKRWYNAFTDWIDSLWPDMGKGQEVIGGTKGGVPRLLLFTLLGVTAVVLIGFLIRMVMLRRRTDTPQREPETMMPDLSDESVLADDLPPDKWLELARDLMEAGDFRLAMRALYLGTLSKLAEHRLVTIAGYKSNREYCFELMRRAHEKPDILGLFEESVMTFDRIWYGMHDVSRIDVERFAETQTTIKAGCV